MTYTFALSQSIGKICVLLILKMVSIINNAIHQQRNGLRKCSIYIKRNENGSFVETWMYLVTFIQSEVSHKEKTKAHILTHICGI